MFWYSPREKKNRCQFIYIPFSIVNAHVKSSTNPKEVSK